MIRTALSITLIAIFLAGCTMAPWYTRPAPPIPTDWPSGEAYKKDASGTPVPVASKLPWQEFINDERLQKVITMALDNNRDLRIATLNVDRARAIYGIQRAELFPTLDALGAGVKQRVSADLSDTGSSKITERYSADLGILSWEIDLFGRIRSLKDKALEEYLATEYVQQGEHSFL